MKIYNNLIINKKHQDSVVAIGNFDGIHLGHQKVINQARQKAKKNRLPFGIITFEPMPAMFFNKKLKNHRINSLIQKKNQLKKLKVDFLIIINFNKNFSQLSAEKFINKIIFKKTKCKFLYVSKNFKFGFKRQGNIKTLKKFEKKYNFISIVTKPFKKNNKIISSTYIRKLLEKGFVHKVNKLLKKKWCIVGKVEKGRMMGKKIGFPTCNIDIKDYIIAKPGVYAVKTKINNNKKFYKGIANLGYRPTFNQKVILLEVNIFNFYGNLYNKKLIIEFIKFIREEKKFKGMDELKNQIKKDLLKVKRIK